MQDIPEGEAALVPFSAALQQKQGTFDPPMGRGGHEGAGMGCSVPLWGFPGQGVCSLEPPLRGPLSHLLPTSPGVISVFLTMPGKAGG